MTTREQLIWAAVFARAFDGDRDVRHPTALGLAGATDEACRRADIAVDAYVHRLGARRLQIAYARAAEVLGSADEANVWMAKGQRGLPDRGVPRLLVEAHDEGLKAVLNLLRQIEAGVFV